MQPKNTQDQSHDGLVLEVLPNGEPAWLKPERRSILAARFWLTDKGHAAIHDELRQEKVETDAMLEQNWSA